MTWKVDSAFFEAHPDFLRVASSSSPSSLWGKAPRSLGRRKHCGWLDTKGPRGMMTMSLLPIGSLPKSEVSVAWHVSRAFRDWILTSVAEPWLVPIAAVAGSIATAAYLDAKYLIRHDLTVGSLASSAAAALAFITERTKQDRLLIYRKLISLAAPEVLV